ncbi:GA113 protein, partial [Corythaixoides concolor]|nr:GA113 protein [Corythaixoides concolor]
MDRQAAYDLFKCFLEKRNTPGIDYKKELPGLLAFGAAKGFFSNPDTVFDHSEWRRFGDALFDGIIEDDKTCKKLVKSWRAVSSALLQHQAEQRAAAAASARLNDPTGVNSTAGPSGMGSSPSVGDCPLPPSVRTLTMPGVGASLGVTASPPAEEAQPLAPPLWERDSPNIESSAPPLGDTNSLVSPDNVGRARRLMWQKIAENTLRDGEGEIATSIVQEAFPATFSQPDAQGNVTVSLTNLDWKLLTQLRATVNESGIKGEPTRQMLDYLWGTNILLPSDIRSIMKLILSQHQQLLFNAHWQAACQESVAIVRVPGDPLHGVTLQELLGLGPYFRAEAQALLGPDKIKESMRLARQALDRIKEPGGIPSYMGIKQGREEPFGTFIDRVANAIQAAGVPDYLKGTILKQCAIQNCNPATRNILATLPGTWTIEEGLERMAQVPVGPQAMLAEAIKELGASLQQQALITQQAQATQNQVLAALAPLQTSTPRPSIRVPLRLRCFRCSMAGHMRRNCGTNPVWCKSCRSDTHSDAACRRSASGNGRHSGRSRPATTQKAAAYSATHVNNPFVSDLQPEAASGWTLQQQ